MRRHTAKLWTVALFCVVIGALCVPRQGAAANAVPKPLKIVLLGDSYTAGNGARDPLDFSRKYYVGPKVCHRSPNNWGGQTANSLSRTYAVRVSNRACSDAVISNILNPRDLETRLVLSGHDCPAPIADEYWEKTKGEDGFDVCHHRLRPQIDAIDSSTDLVLMTIGGNDARFSDIVVNCFAAFLRTPTGCSRSVDFANAQLRGIEDELTASLLEIHKRIGPHGKVVVVAYPYLVSDVNYRLWSLFDLNVYHAGRKIRELQRAGDAADAAAVAKANAAAGRDFAVFVDGTKPLFEGHLPNPDQLGPRNPQRWLNEFEGFDAREFYHLNPHGHQAIASMLVDALASFELGQPLLAEGSSVSDRPTTDVLSVATLPDAWVGDAYVAAIDRPVLLDASGSFDPGGGSLTSFEWDFTGDGVFDELTEVPTVSHTYTSAFDGVVTVRVTGPGGMSVVSAPLLVNESGSSQQVDDTPCGKDLLGAPNLFEGDGRLKNCTVEGMPTSDRDGVTVASGATPDPTTTTSSTSTTSSPSTTVTPATTIPASTTTPTVVPSTNQTTTSPVAPAVVSPPTTNSEELVPITGSTPLPLVNSAATVVLVGVGCTALARRRRRA